MEPGALKPILTALALPPAGPLLLALLGLALAWRWRRAGIALAAAGVGITLALSLNAVAVFLARHLVQLPPPITDAALARVQAIVVLGGGVLPQAPEYGAAQPSEHTLARLRHGAWLARRSGKPLAFAGGIGWSASGTDAVEGTVARRVLREDYGLTVRWLDDRSRDTRENAERMATLLRPDGVRRIALVSDAWHLQRAEAHFRGVGLEVVPAPTQFPATRERTLLEWLPSTHGLTLSRQVLREWLGLRLTAGR